jgi:hypothetical protein
MTRFILLFKTWSEIAHKPSNGSSRSNSSIDMLPEALLYCLTLRKHQVTVLVSNKSASVSR